MLLLRLVFGLLLVASLLCFAMHLGTGQLVWRRRGIVLLKWTLIAGLAAFGIIILERLPMLL